MVDEHDEAAQKWADQVQREGVEALTDADMSDRDVRRMFRPRPAEIEAYAAGRRDLSRELEHQRARAQVEARMRLRRVTALSDGDIRIVMRRVQEEGLALDEDNYTRVAKDLDDALRLLHAKRKPGQAVPLSGTSERDVMVSLAFFTWVTAYAREWGRALALVEDLYCDADNDLTSLVLDRVLTKLREARG